MAGWEWGGLKGGFENIKREASIGGGISDGTIVYLKDNYKKS